MDWLNRWFVSHQKLAARAQSLAAQCLDDFWQIVEHRALTLSPAEVRGYVRARAGLTVRRAVEAVIAQSPHFAGRREQLTDLTLEQLNRQVSARVRALHQATPSRRAA
jgi:hypothetical protein